MSNEIRDEFYSPWRHILKAYDIDIIEEAEIDIEKVKAYRKFYPRKKDKRNQYDPVSYAERVDNLPPILVSKDYVIVDGMRRLMAFKQKGYKKVPCVVTDISVDMIKYISSAINCLDAKWDKDIMEMIGKNCTSQEIFEKTGIPEITANKLIKKYGSSERAKRKYKEYKIVNKWYRKNKTIKQILNLTDINKERVEHLVDKFDKQGTKKEELKGLLLGL